MDFDDVPSSGNPILTSLTSQGFRFTSTHFHTVDQPGLFPFGGSVSNGTTFIGEEDGSIGGPITVQRADGGPFRILSFDAGEFFVDRVAAAAGGFPNADGVRMSASVTGIGVVETTFFLDGIADGDGGVADFQTFSPQSIFFSLQHATFTGLRTTGSPGGFSMDNFVILLIPEPTLTATFGMITSLLVRTRNGRSTKGRILYPHHSA
jgi:hypothetical protein